jgi:carboxylate-amine ligase
VLSASSGPAAIPHAFGRSAPFTVGVEEELFLVDHQSHAVARVTDEILARVPRLDHGHVLGEFCDGVIELATPICAHATEAVDHLRTLRAAVRATGVAELMGAGVHPATPYGNVVRRSTPHYTAVAEDTRSLLHQSTYCGLHVHVGMPDAEMAIAAFNGMRKWVPLLQALSSNSPLWYGRDSGLASARTVLCHALPRTGLPDALRDWAHYEDTVGALMLGGELDDISSIWWDIRPHPRLGTLEIRLADAQSSLTDVEGLVALIHGLVQHEALVADRDHPPKAVLDEAMFRAIRDGLDARFSTGGPMRHVQEVARHAIHVASPYLARAGCVGALAHVERILAEGNGADRQRAALARGGMSAVLRHLVAQTAADDPTARAPVAMLEGAA